MKKLLVVFSLTIGLLFASNANAQTKITFAKRAYKKTIAVTIPANGNKSFSIGAKTSQVINVLLSGDVATSRTNEFPVVSANLANGEEGVDEWQDGESYLSIFAGRTFTFVFNVSNSSNRARTFKMEVAVTNNRIDYLGG